MIVISNATPLIYLGRIDQVELLKKLYKKIYITPSVKQEVIDKGKEMGYSDAVKTEKFLGKWIFVEKVKIDIGPLFLKKFKGRKLQRIEGMLRGLHDGEKEVFT